VSRRFDFVRLDFALFIVVLEHFLLRAFRNGRRVFFGEFFLTTTVPLKKDERGNLKRRTREEFF
jgi:hypothetical protein